MRAQLGGSQRSLTTALGELTEARAEVARLRGIAELADVLLAPERERRTHWPETTKKLGALLRQWRTEVPRG